MTDYSEHLIKTQHLMRDLYELCQNHQYMEAMTLCMDGLAELRMAYNAIHNLADNQNPGMITGSWRNHGEET